SRLDPNVFWGGEQAAWWGPMAIAVIAGLSFATALTLIVVPVLYSVLDDIGRFFTRFFATEDPAHVAEKTAAEPATPSRRRRRFAAALSRIGLAGGSPAGAGT